ncbi:EARP-interacting protein homolog [Lycorma delicatula]|uniref:EARP-interacting protein homolog n=1 Tax=Lycorma delicatula TaxID=130591 RepID=UPI003F518E3A
MDDATPLSCLYGLEFPARSLAPQLAETDVVRFLVGTQSLKMTNNQVHLVELSEETGALYSKVYQHEVGEVWSLTSSPKDADIFATCYNTLRPEENDCIMRSALWRMPEITGEEDTVVPLKHICTFDTESHGVQVKVTAFHPSESTQLSTVVDNKVLIWDMGEAEARLNTSILLEGKGHPKFTTGKWNHQQVGSQFATANDTTVRGWDIRAGNKQVWAIENAHTQLVRDLDFNPNRLFFVATCGDDASCKFWDIRQPAAPVITRSDHSHWIWVVRYNQLRDQLVLSASSDGVLLLTSVASIASDTLDTSDTSNSSFLPDTVLATHDQHEDSVYCAEWSSADPWCFASLSYDGRLLLNKVSKSLMYKYL